MSAPPITVTLAFPTTAAYSGYFVLDSSTLSPGTAQLAGTTQVVDVSADLIGGIGAHRGRNREVDTFPAGSLTFRLRNDARKYDPLNTASPYYPGVNPRTPVQISVASQVIFTGYVESYDIGYEKGSYSSGKGTSYVDVTCTDGKGILANQKLHTETFGSELSGTRITNVLNLGEVNFPSTRNLAPGTMTLQGGTYDNVTALDHLEKVAASEGGWLYVDRQGNLTFQDHNVWPLLKAMFPNGEMTITDTGGPSYNGPLFAYREAKVSNALTMLYNRVEAQRSGGVMQIEQDATSAAAYFIRGLSLGTDLLLDLDSNVDGLARTYLKRYKDPLVRFASMTIEMSGLTLEQQQFLAATDICRTAICERTPPGGGPTITRLSIVEGMDWNFDVASSTYTCTLYFADLTNTTDFILDNTAMGVLDTNTLGLGSVNTAGAATTSAGVGTFRPLAPRH